MRRAPGAILLAGLSLCLTASADRAQDRKPAPSQESAEDEKPYSPPAAWKSVEIGNYYYRRKKYNAALSRYQEAVKTNPYYPQGFLGLGRVYDKIGLKRKALESYQKYLDLLPSEKDALEAKEVQKAVTRLKRALKIGSLRSQEAAAQAAPQAQ
jgi:tetratricopeptide (TPR) repeat protein